MRFNRSVPSHLPGRHPEVFLDEVTGDGQRQQGDEEDGRHVGDDAQGGHAQQGGAREALQGGGDVLVDCVCVRGEPVEDAAEGRRLKQPEGTENSRGSNRLLFTYCFDIYTTPRSISRII